jgi:hypothetical protein
MEPNNWTSTFEEDSGWNRPYIDDETLVPKKYKTLRTKVLEKNLVCASNGNVYIFLAVLNKWAILCSDEATISLNALMEMDSASVNYDKAFRPYVTFIERNAVENIASKIPTSICIGTNRLRVSRVGNGLSLTKCEAVLIENPSYLSSSAIASLCYMPLSIRRWPRGWTRTNDYPMYRFIAPLFPNQVELQTIEWAIGNALIDPTTSSKAVILYGEGGTGKSTLLAAIKTSLMGCCGSIPDKSLVGLAKGMSNSVASIVVSNRIVTAGDVGGYDDSTNLSVIKSLTGHDYISIPPLSARSSCSLFYATNRLDDPRKNLEWMTSAIMRRVVVVSMSTDALSYAETTMPQDSVSRLDFALRCIHTRLTHSSMPVSGMSIILTLLGSLATEVMPFLTEDDDENITERDGSAVLGIVAGITGIEPAQIGELAKKISASAVRSVRGVYHLVGICPTDLYYDNIDPEN